MSLYHSPYEGYSEFTDSPGPFDLHEPSEFSVEVDHLYPEDFVLGVDGLARRFANRMLLAHDKLARREQQLGRAVSRSTCMLIDDYYKLTGEDQRPATLLPEIVLPAIAKAEEETGVLIDYLGREAACAEYESIGEKIIQPAETTIARLVQMPMPGQNGAQVGIGRAWLTNGQRSSGVVDGQWVPPEELDTGGHAVFMDIELFSEKKRKGKIDKRFSCALLAATWQLLRLGLLPNYDQLAVVPEPMPDLEYMKYSRWGTLPAVMQRQADASPFDAYRTLSVLPRRYLKTEAAVGVILESVDYNERTRARMDNFAGQLGLEQYEPWERREYIFD